MGVKCAVQILLGGLLKMPRLRNKCAWPPDGTKLPEVPARPVTGERLQN